VKDSSVPLGGTVPVVAIRFEYRFLSSLVLSGCLLTVIPPIDVDGCTSRLVTFYKGIPERMLHEI